MSKFYDRADAIKAVIEALPELAGVSVLVYRQKDLQTEMDVSLARVGAVVVIVWTGGQNTDPDDDAHLQLSSTYTIQVTCKQIISPTSEPMDNIAESIAKGLHGWNPTPSLGCGYEANITGIVPVPDDDYLIFQIDVSITINITS